MGTTLRASLLALCFASVTACTQRQVEVRTAPSTVTEQGVQVTNNLSQAVNVYVTSNGSGEQFLRQVPANTVERVPVQGVARGVNATFKAVTVDGSRTYQSRSVPLSGLFAWNVP